MEILVEFYEAYSWNASRHPKRWGGPRGIPRGVWACCTLWVSEASHLMRVTYVIGWHMSAWVRQVRVVSVVGTVRRRPSQATPVQMQQDNGTSCDEWDKVQFSYFLCVISSLGYIILKGGFSILKTIHFGKVLGRHLFGLVVVIKRVYEHELIIHILKWYNVSNIWCNTNKHLCTPKP